MLLEKCETITAKEYVKFIYDGEVYYFTIDSNIPRSDYAKKVYIGHFEYKGDEKHCNTKPPKGLEFNRKYCLKTATIYLPIESSTHPQTRHFWDFYPFEGDNLRQVLALNDDAREMSRELTNGSLNPLKCEERCYKCAVIEPVYQLFSIDDFPSYEEKIDCMLQIISGLKQLLNNKTLKKFKITAHRDLKFQNIMVQEMPNGIRRLRLIDFPTIKFSSIDASVDENHTILGAFSPTNTAPEDVISSNGYSVSSKTDVFALGGMLAEIFKVWDFGTGSNPLKLLFESTPNINLSNTNECADFFVHLNATYPHGMLDGPNWLEKSLDARDMNAAWSRVERFCPDIHMLFRSSTAIAPNQRIDLHTFENRLRNALDKLVKESGEMSNENKVLVTNNTYFLIDTANLDIYQDLYIETIGEILKKTPDKLGGLLTYDWNHVSKTLTPDRGAMDLPPKTFDEIQANINSVEPCEIGKRDVSTLKSPLYELCMYLSNKALRKNFNGQIHVFTPVLPYEAKLCGFNIYINRADGTMGAESLSAETIAQRFGSDFQIFVHTFKDQELENAESWYYVVPFEKLKRDMILCELSKKQSEPDVPQQSKTPHIVERRFSEYYIISSTSDNIN